MSEWHGDGKKVISDGMPADPSLMGCGAQGLAVEIDGVYKWTVCIKPHRHDGECKYVPLGHLDAARAE